MSYKILVVVCCFLITSCDHAEETYSAQNKTIGSLADEQMLGSTRHSQDELYQMEEEVNRACRDVQKIGILMSDGKDPSIGDYLSAIVALGECDTTTDRVNKKLAK